MMSIDVLRGPHKPTEYRIFTTPDCFKWRNLTYPNLQAGTSCRMLREVLESQPLSAPKIVKCYLSQLWFDSTPCVPSI